jgi:hypothetical protein
VVRQIADAFERALAEADPTPEGEAECPILIENAAGSGGTVGRSLEEIHLLIDACNSDDRLGLCIDTQHLWASGFDYSTVAGTERLIKEIELSVGMDRLRCFHFNDSKTELGGNRDRHANIGEGTIGTRGLATLTGHPLIRNLPLLLEVPGAGDGPRAEDVEAGKQVVRAGIALWEGSPDWENLLPVVVPAAPSTSATKSAKSPAKANAPAKATAKKAAKRSATSTKKSAKKTVKKAAKSATITTTKATKKLAKKTSKATAKKATVKATKSTKKLAKKTSKKAIAKAAKKLTKRTAKKMTPKIAKATKKVAKKAPKKLSPKSGKKLAKKSTKKLAKKTTKKSTKKLAKKTAKKSTKK